MFLDKNPSSVGFKQYMCGCEIIHGLSPHILSGLGNEGIALRAWGVGDGLWSVVCCDACRVNVKNE